MKALVVAPQPFFTPRGTPFSVYYRTLMSSELGVKIDLLTYGEGEDVDIPNTNFIRIPRFKLFGNVKIGPSFLKLFLDIFIFFKMFELLMLNKYDIVHAHEESIFFAFIFRRIFKFKMIYDMHSSLPQQLTNFNFTKSRVIINLFKTAEEACLKSADAVITICPDLYDYVNKIIPDKEKHFLIENSIFDKVNLRDIENPNPKNKITNTNFEIPYDKKIIVYAGTLEKYQGIEILIRSFPTVLNQIPDAFLIIVGGTKEQVNHFKRSAEELEIKKNIIFTGLVSQIEAKFYSSIANILVSPRSNGTNTPLKIYEQLASGKPLVATNIHSHTQVLSEDVAFLVKPTPEDLAKGMISALNSNGYACRKAENAKVLYETKYSRDIYKQKLKNLFELLA
jgi:glycosyltransferase involved in cell wall biosynthesis